MTLHSICQYGKFKNDTGSNPELLLEDFEGYKRSFYEKWFIHA